MMNPPKQKNESDINKGVGMIIASIKMHGVL